MPLKCIKCGKEAEYVVDGNSFCGEHTLSPTLDAITKTEQKPAPFLQPEPPAEPKNEDISTQAAVPLAQAEAKETTEQKSTLFIQPPLEPKKDIQVQTSPLPLTAEAKATGKPEIPPKTNWSRYVIRTPIKEHWNYYLIIALLVISVIFFTLYLSSL